MRIVRSPLTPYLFLCVCACTSTKTDPASDDTVLSADESDSDTDEWPDLSAGDTSNSRRLAPTQGNADFYTDDKATYFSGSVPPVAAKTSVTLGVGNRAHSVDMTPEGNALGYVAKFNKEGALVWGTFITVTGNDEIDFDGLHPVDGALFVIGNIDCGSDADTTLSFENGDAVTFDEYGKWRFITKLAPDGAHLWTRRLKADWMSSPVVTDSGGIAALFSDSGVMRIDTAKKPIVDEPEYMDVVLLQYDADGTVAFTEWLGGSSNFHPSLSYLDDGSFLIFGSTLSSILYDDEDERAVLPPFDGGAYRCFMLRYDANGRFMLATNTISLSHLIRVRPESDRLVITGSSLSSVLIQVDAEMVALPITEDSITLVAAFFNYDGELLSVSKVGALLDFDLNDTSCEFAAYRVGEAGEDIVLGCENDQETARSLRLDADEIVTLEAASQQFIAVRIGPDGDITDVGKLASAPHSNRLIHSRPSTQAAFTGDHLTLWTSGSPPLEWDGNTNDETSNRFFDTTVGIFDADFALQSMRKLRTVRNRYFTDQGDTYVHVLNKKGFAMMDDFLSIEEEVSFVGKYRATGQPEWEAAVGLNNSKVYPSRTTTTVVTTTRGARVTLGNDATRTIVEPAPNAVTTYLARLDNETGDLLSHEAAVAVSAADIEDDLSRLTQCTDEVLTLAEAGRYRDYETAYPLRDAIWRRIAEWVPTQCLRRCTPPDTCTIKAACTDGGVAVELQFDESMRETIDFYLETQSWDVSLTREKSNEWTEIHYQGGGANSDNIDGPSHIHDEATVSWRGTLIPSLPADGEMQFSLSHDIGADDAGNSGTHYTLEAGDCDISWETESFNWDLYRDIVVINGHTYESVPSSDDCELGHGYIDGECVADIDIETWKTMGPCSVASE